MLQKIIILGCGGTIAGLANDLSRPDEYQSARLGVDALLAGSEIQRSDELEFEQVAQIDSKDAEEVFWRALLARVSYHHNRPEVQGVVITHGTDTLEETAFLLSVLLPANKPVVLTGAMRPANHPHADGPGNLRDSLKVVRDKTLMGVGVVMSGRWWSGSQVQKLRAFDPDAFGSFDPLTKGEVGQSGETSV